MSREAYVVGFRAITLAIALIAAPLMAWADEADAPRPKSLFILLLSSGKGDDTTLRILKSAVNASGRVRITEEPGAADLMGRLEIARNLDGRDLNAMVLTRDGAVVLRATQRVRPKRSEAEAIDALARDIVSTIDSSRPKREPPPVASNEPREVEEPRPVERSRRDDTDDVRPSRLSFVFGADVGVGPWFADSRDLVNGSVTGFDLTRYGPAFTQGLDGRWKGTLNLHGGWRFYRAAGIEAAIQSSAWGNNGLGAGGAILAGGRFIGFPLEAFIKDRKYELGVELGAGYVFVGGPYYNMDGKYLSLGLSGEYPLKPWMSLQVNYRMFMSFLNRFFLHYRNDFSEPVEDFTAYWHTFTVGVVFHIQSRL